MTAVSLTETLQIALLYTGIALPRFGFLAGYLMAHGSLTRDESQAQNRLYDEVVRCQPVLADFFACVGLRLVHSIRNESFRLFPPAPDQDEDVEQYCQALRARLPKGFSAYVLVLRHLYQQRLDVGDLEDSGELLLSRLEIEQGLSDLLDMAPPNPTTRSNIYRLLASQRLVRIGEGREEETEDLIFAVRPHIVDYVTDAQLLAARAYLATNAAPAMADLEEANGESEVDR